jgi:pimeloyl-ACP methyl ester carboxylesterase
VRRLGDDVVAVLDALSVSDPVLIGHSIGGEELSAVSTYHPGRASGLAYLDAGGPFALYSPKYGDYTPALAELKDDLSALQKNLFDDGLISKTLADVVFPSLVYWGTSRRNLSLIWFFLNFGAVDKLGSWSKL